MRKFVVRPAAKGIENFNARRRPLDQCVRSGPKQLTQQQMLRMTVVYVEHAAFWQIWPRHPPIFITVVETLAEVTSDFPELQHATRAAVESIGHKLQWKNVAETWRLRMAIVTDLVRDSYRYRELIWALALRELKIRYKRSLLGFLWALLNPALLMIVLTVVFSKVLISNIPHYGIFILSTLLPWTFFSQCLAYAVDSMVSNGDLIKKVAVSKSVFPLAAVVSNMINLLLSIIPLALIVLVMGHPFFVTWAFLPVPLIALMLFTAGATFFFATANVYYRDVAHIVQILLQVWFYVTPIIYPLTIFPEKYRWMFQLNPLIYVLNDFRLAVYYGQMPRPQSVAASFACGLLSLLIGFAIFRKNQESFVYYL
ncbi:MAG: ABC transporter permease [Bryobacteraceae bacterium]